MNDYLHRLFEHVFWADTRVLELLEGSEPGSDALRLFAHVLAAERVWLLRLRGEDSTVQAIWPELSREECRALAADNASAYAALLGNLHEADLAADVVYSNSQGVPYRSAIIDILTHVALHGSYHRGQIATAMRRAGGEPVNTDYITFVRETGSTAG